MVRKWRMMLRGRSVEDDAMANKRKDFVEGKKKKGVRLGFGDPD